MLNGNHHNNKLTASDINCCTAACIIYKDYTSKPHAVIYVSDYYGTVDRL